MYLNWHKLPVVDQNSLFVMDMLHHHGNDIMLFDVKGESIWDILLPGEGKRGGVKLQKSASSKRA
jgi:hypothetical protein